MMDTHAISTLADFFVIATAASERQLNAIADDIQKNLKKHSIASRVEGTNESGWILIDNPSVIVHLFTPAMRDYYQLEELWEKAPVVVRIR